VRLLAETRDMLLKNDYHNTTQVGEEIIEDPVEAAVGITDGLALFKLHRSSVSDTAFKLMTTCRSIMEEAVSIPVFAPTDPLSSLAAGLYRAAREGLSMYRAIIPVSYAKEIANVPRTAAVLHNDCVYLAHHCHTLGLEYKPRFPPAEPDDAKGQLLRQTCMFVDMVPLFREIADRSLGEMLDKQAQQVSSLVGERTQLLGKALSSNEDLAEWSDAETALEAGLYHLRHLAETWRPILATDILNRSMSFLADVMLNIFLDQLSKANDISTAASQFVNTLFSKAIEDLSMLLNPSRSRVWDRFIAIGKFMDMSLADIQVALSDGVFRNVTAPELSKLVTACFDNSPKRKQLLQSLSSSNQRV
jgi:centromere/kinetochore protein ZW10